MARERLKAAGVGPRIVCVVRRRTADHRQDAGKEAGRGHAAAIDASPMPIEAADSGIST